MTIYTIANWITGSFEAYFLFLMAETFLRRRKNVSKNIYYAAILILAILINLSNALFSIGVLGLILMIVMGFLISFFYEGNLKIRMVISVFFIMISAITEVITLFTLSIVFNKPINILIENGYLRLIGIVISKTLGYVVIKYITYRASRELRYMNTNYWLLFFLMFLSSTLTICTFCRILEEDASVYVRNLIIVCTCGLSITTVVILYLYERTLKQQDILSQQQLSQMQLTSQIKHYSALIMSQEQIRKTRHDLRNHLFSIKAQIDKTEYAQAIEYINSLLEYTESNNIDFDTGNTVLDAILSVKKEEAEKMGIRFTAKLCIPAKLPIADSDICVIFGNALDNAIEACERLSEERYISIELVYGEDTLMCKIENSCSIDTDVNSATTKNDIHNHGIGRMNIERTLEHYTSVCDVEHLGNRYILYIMFMDIDKNDLQ